MPSTSAKQAKFMRAVAHSPKFAKKVGVSQSVGKDFEMADKKKKMKKFGNGGTSTSSTPNPNTSGGSPEADDVLVTTARGRKLLEEQRRREAERERANDAKRARADKLLGIKTNKEGGSIRSRGLGLPDSMLPRGTESRRPQTPSQTTKPSASTAAPQTVKSTPPKTETVKINEKPKYVKLEAHKKGGKVMKKTDKAGRALVKKSADTMGRAMKMNKGGKCYAGGGLVAGHKSADGIATKGKTKGKMVAMKKGGKC